MKKYSLIQKSKLIVLADQVMVSASAFATNILLARALGIEHYGIFSVIGLMQFFCLSVSTGITSQVYQVVYPSLDVTSKRNYTTGLFYILAIISAVILCLGLLVYLFMPLQLHEARALTLATSLGTCLFLLQDFIRKVLLTQQHHAKVLAVDAIANLSQLLLLGFCWWMGTLTLQLAIWIIGLTFIPAIMLGIKWIGIRMVNMADIHFAWAIQQSRTGWILLSNIMQWGTGYFFVIAAGWWVSAASLGALRLAQYIFGLLNVVLQAIENYALPKASALLDNKTDYIKALLKRMLLMMLPVLLLLSIFSKQILTLAGGAGYAQYHYVVYGLSAVYLLITIGYPIRIAIRSMQLNREYFIGYVWSMLFTAVSAYWLLCHWQLTGVLAGLFIIQCITVGYWFSVLKHRKILSWRSFI